MAIINHAKREINAKIVYYGPEGTGKQSSLQYIYDRVKPSLRGELKSPSTNNDSLFFFDFSPFENPVFGDFRLRFHVYTLPGKVVNPAAWKMTLKGADGLVIVADASPTLAPVTRESISELRAFLSAYGVGLNDTPCVLQLIKGHNLCNSSAAEIAATLDLSDVQAFFSEPACGTGVLEVLSQLSRVIMARIGQDDALQVIEDDVILDGVDDTDVSATLLPLEIEPETLTCEPVQGVEEKSLLSTVKSEGGIEQLQVALSGDGAVCNGGVVRVPLDVTLGGATRRLVVSIAIDHA
jgi:hypothetical protein